MMKKFLVFALAIAMQNVFAQLDYSRQYDNAKALFRDGKYNLAMESFKPLIAYDQKNPYVEYASFYYALSAYYQNFKAVAKDMLNQVKTLYPKWDKIQEVNFWLGKIHFDNHDYFQGLKVFNAIKDKTFQKDIEAVKTAELAAISDVETLRMMLEEYPDDPVIGKAVAAALSKNMADEEDKEQLENIIDHFKLNRADYIPVAPETFYKDRYSVSILLPFMVGTLEPTPGRKGNQVVLDFYNGIRLALDTLAKQDIDISVRAYDTELSVDKIKQLLETEELKNTDLIVGPFFPDENQIVQDFSMQYKINIIHPFSNSSDIIGINPYAYLFQPTSETFGKKSADFIADHAKEKNCMVFYGPLKKDSVLAFNFIREAGEKGLQVLAVQQVDSKETKIITDILATPTEYDEFKYPSEFTLKKDSLSSIFVASDDPLIYTKVVSGVQTRGDSILVMGTENWLEDNAIDIEKYQVLNIFLASPNYIDTEKPAYKVFEEKFMEKHGLIPSNVAKMGYEFMLFIGHQLKEHGVYFQEDLREAGVIPGYLTEGFDYRFSRANQLIPFTAFRNNELTLIEKR